MKIKRWSNLLEVGAKQFKVVVSGLLAFVVYVPLLSVGYYDALRVPVWFSSSFLNAV